jgi:hypothetical protein
MWLNVKPPMKFGILVGPSLDDVAKGKLMISSRRRRRRRAGQRDLWRDE